MIDMKRVQITGTGLTVRGNDIDTDRIIPARFLKCVTFDEVGEHAFEDDRAQAKSAGRVHAFDDPVRQHASVLFVNKNFGCGSSREHAAQAIKKWNDGVRAIVGESFAEIFFGNCLAQGIPCVSVAEADAATLMQACENDPSLAFTVDLDRMCVAYGDATVPLAMPEGARRQLVEGSWDATAELLAGMPQVIAKAQSLPYFGFWE